MQGRRTYTALPLLAVAALLALAAGARAAQDRAREAELFFDTVDVRVANIEIVVTDREGLPVTGLTREDFAIFEDDRPVEVTNFFAVEERRTVAIGDERLDDGASETPELASLGIEAEPETRQLSLVVFVDDFNIRPRNRNVLLGALKEYLAGQLDPRDRVMLVVMDDTVEVIQDFTSDPALLVAAVEKLEESTGSHVTIQTEETLYFRNLQQATIRDSSGGTAGLNFGGVPNLRNYMESESTAERLATDALSLADRRMNRVKATVDALTAFTESLAGLRGRKAVLYLSDGLSTRPADALVQAWLNKYEQWVQVVNAANVRDELSRLTSTIGSSRYDASNWFEELVARASANRVAFYPISTGAGLARSSISAEFEGAGTGAGRRPLSPDVIAMENFSLESSLLQMAEGTGGIAFTRTANVGGLLDRMVQDFETFYSLGYTPLHPQDDQLHEVRVEVKRDDLEVRYLKTYREKDPLQHLQDLTLSALHYGVTDNPLRVALTPGRQVKTGRNKYQVEVMVKIPFNQLLLLPQGEAHTSQVSLFVVARDPRGGISPFQRIDLPIRIANDQILQAMAGAAAYPLQLEIGGGAKRISVGVRDHLARVDSTLVLDLEVGDAASLAEAGSR